MRFKLPALLVTLASLGVPSVGYSWFAAEQCTSVFKKSVNRGMIQGYYLRGYRSYNEASGCMDPYEVVQIIIHPLPNDHGRPGSMYVAASDGRGGALVLQEDGQWIDYLGGLHAPTARFESLPSSQVITVFDSRGDIDVSGNLWRSRNVGRPNGPALICDLIRSHGSLTAYIGAGYGAIQDDQQGTIEHLLSNPHANIDLDHMRGAFAYTDGLQSKKYGTVLQFNCGCSTLPGGGDTGHCDNGGG
ncbi:hypothetical protein TMEC54S_00345 [Thauera mechernichensis]